MNDILLRFRVAGCQSRTAAKLRMTWNTAPAAAGGAPGVATIVTPVVQSTANLVDVTPIVTGNGTFTIRVTGNSSDGSRHDSKDGNAAALASLLQVSCASTG